MRGRRWSAFRLVAATGLAVAGHARAQDADAGSAEDGRASDALDLVGPPVEFHARPTDAPDALVACSFQDPLCVHAARGTSPALLLETLASAERAYEVLTGALRLPGPALDLDSGRLDVFVTANAPGLGAALPERRVPVAAYDRVSAFLLLDAAERGCARDTAVARALARASLWAAAPATDEATAEAETAYLARLAVPCAMARVDGVDRFQSRPDQALPDEGAGLERARGAGLFYWWLDDNFGASPGSTVLALWALAPTTTRANASRWAATPNVVDVLTASFKDTLMTGSTVADLWADFAVGRAFAGDDDDGVHLPESRALGSAARVHHTWDLPWPDRPRSVASAHGVAPTGAAYVAVAHEGAPAGARLRVEIAWEEHAMMRWRAVKIDGAGKELSEVAVEGQRRGTGAQITLVDLDRTRTILLVGTNVGDPSRAFEPDEGTWEPHGWTVSVASEP